MVWSQLISTLIGVIVGGLITLGVNLYLQGKEREVQGWGIGSGLEF